MVHGDTSCELGRVDELLANPNAPVRVIGIHQCPILQPQRKSHFFRVAPDTESLQACKEQFSGSKDSSGSARSTRCLQQPLGSPIVTGMEAIGFALARKLPAVSGFSDESCVREQQLVSSKFTKKPCTPLTVLSLASVLARVHYRTMMLLPTVPSVASRPSPQDLDTLFGTVDSRYVLSIVTTVVFLLFGVEPGRRKG